MPFGLTNAPAVFQALVTDVLCDFLNVFVFVYLDDIFIFSPDEQIHIQHVRKVLQHVLEHQLYDKAKKVYGYLAHSYEQRENTAIPGFCKLLQKIH